MPTMIPIKNAVEIEKMRKASKIASSILDHLSNTVKEGDSTYDIDQQAKRLFSKHEVKSACFRYRAGNKIYPGHICISVNDEVVHGIGSEHRFLKNGDIVSLDVSVVCDGFVSDNARTVIIGTVDQKTELLVKVTEDALARGIQMAVPEKRVGDISFAIQSYVESNGFSVVREFVGHGIGRSMHEEPQIPNFGQPGTGAFLKAGMTLAIEPMVNMGHHAVKYASDGWTVLTKDGQCSAHFEHTVLVTSDGPEILTQI